MPHTAAHAALLDLVQRLTTAGRPPDDVLAQVVAALGTALDYIDVGVLLLDPADPEQLLLRASNYAGFPDAVGRFRQPKDSGLIGRAMRAGRQVLVADVRQDPDYLPLPGVPVVAELVTPIRVRGQLQGVLNVESLHALTAGEAATVATAATLLGAALEAADKRRIRTAVLGTSWWAEGAHLPGLRALPHVALTALCGRNPARLTELAARFDVPRTFTDYHQLLAEIQPEVVVVATPNHQHAPMTLAALAAGAHVICEKPLGLTLEEAEAMLAQAQARGRRHLTFFTYRGMPIPRYVKQLLAEGYLGRLHHAQASYLHGSWLNPDRPASWKTRLAEGGSGVLGDLGAHGIDLLQWWFGPARRAAASLQTFITERPRADGTRAAVETDDAAALVLEFAAGGQATLQLSRVAAGRRNYQRFELYGERGVLVYEYEPVAGHVGRLWGARAGEKELTPLDPPAEWTAGFEGADSFPAVYGALTAGFWAGVLDPAAPAAHPDFADGLAAQRVIDAAALSAASGHWETV